MSNSDNNLKLITLYREAVHTRQDDDSSPKRKRHLTLTMDYFDALEVKSFSLDNNRVLEFFGQDIDEELNESDIAMHSIPLYRPENDFTRGINDGYYGDPFEEDWVSSYLCLIQVYITPEVLRRLNVRRYKNKRDLLEAAEVYDLFFRDLHRAVKEYIEENPGQILCYCIYQSLSVGDFMIGIRCRNIDEVFQIMETIRRRKFVNVNGVEEKDIIKEPNSLILYKTYTIVSINDQIITEENNYPETQGDGNRFILRAILSNHYWNDEKIISAKYEPEEYLHGPRFRRLHGRYNFSVELSEAAFWHLLPTIGKRKLNREIKSLPSKKLEDGEPEICEFLEYLLNEGYISQLNERYVADNASWKKNEKDKEVEKFCALRAEDGYFSDAIKKEIKNLKERIRKTGKNIRELDTSRDTISYNMNLLKRMTNTCGAINGYSDSRIYAVIIIRLIHAVLNGMDEYLKYYAKTDDHSIIKPMDSELNNSVADLNEFSKYILDNSLQSLQAPDYNLESHTSVEKLMMSYSAFLQSVIDWYGSTKFAKNINGLQEKYVTIMVPRTVDSGLTTRAYFYRLDDSVRAHGEKLLVVHCPSFYTLTDFAGSLGRLLHELAHNLRYEKREKRNRIIIRYSANLLFNQLAADMVERFRSEVDALRDPVTIQNLLEECFTDCFITYIEDYIEYYIKEYLLATAPKPVYQNMKLMNLIEVIRKSYNDLIRTVSYLEKLKVHIDTFVRSSDNYSLANDEVKQIWNFYERFFADEPSVGERADKQEKEQKSLVDLLGGRFIDGSGNGEMTAAHGLYDMLRSGNQGEDPIVFYSACMRSADFIKKLTKRVTETVNTYQDTADGRKIADFLSMGYYSVSDTSDINFMEFAQKSLYRTKTDSLTFWEENLYLYRETASDLFMAQMLGLTPFGYLNYCSRYIPTDGMLARNYLSRIALTIYAMSGTKKDSDGEQLYAVWQDIFYALCRYIGKEIYDYLKINNQKVRLKEDLIDFVKRMEHFSGEEVRNKDKMVQLVDLWSQYLKWLSDAMKNDSFSSKLRHCAFLCRNFCDIFRASNPERAQLQWSKDLTDDLVGGGEALAHLHAELMQSPLWKYCGLVREEFNEPQDIKGAVRRTFSPEDMTKFVLNMHYDMVFNSIEYFRDRHKK